MAVNGEQTDSMQEWVQTLHIYIYVYIYII